MNKNLLGKALRYALLAFVGLRLWTIIIMLIASMIMPGQIRSNFPFVEETAYALEQGWFNLFFLAPWYRFDTVHYLEIAAGGYSYATLTTWAPLYPALIYLLHLTGISPMAAAIFISNLACFVAFIIIYIFVSQINNEAMARRVLMFLVTFPSAFFLMAGYTESLFLMLSTACLWALWKRHWPSAAILAAFATMTRFQGILLVIPAFWLIWLDLHMFPVQTWAGKLIRLCSPLWALGLPVLVFSGWVAWVHYGLGYPWIWSTLNDYWQQHSGFPWEGILGNITSLIGLRQVQTAINPLAQFFDLTLVILCLTALFLSIRKTQFFPVFLQLFAWSSLLTILSKVDNLWLLVSTSRYLLSVFPVFMALALLVKSKKTQTIWMLVGLCCQLLLMLCFYHWIWVA